MRFLQDVGLKIGTGTAAQMRHYLMPAPRGPHHQAELTAFGTCYWTVSRDLRAYQQILTAAERARLESERCSHARSTYP